MEQQTTQKPASGMTADSKWDVLTKEPRYETSLKEGSPNFIA